jgi:DNA-binding transcriptional MocR family regulator
MEFSPYRHWVIALQNSEKHPAYLLIADLIAEDIDQGKLKGRDKLPTLRQLASILALNYTTVARAYNEAKKRGLILSRPGMGTFIKGGTRSIPLRGGSDYEMTMNLPPEPQISSLTKKIRRGFEAAMDKRDIYSVMRYQDFGGSIRDKEAAINLLKPLLGMADADRMLVCPGIHSALVALLSLLARQGGTVCVQSLVYPGLKAIATQLGVRLIAIDSDSNGPIIRSLEARCKTENVSAIYLNPTIQNPSAHTISLTRRKSIADLALRYNIPIIEDDAYALLPANPIPPIATFAPEITYYLTGLSKYFGAGMRTAYLYAPSKVLAQRTAGGLRSLSVMASPVTTAMATHWIEDGTIGAMVTAIRHESIARQLIVKRHLSDFNYSTDPEGFHLWLNLPKDMNLNPSLLAAYLRSQKISAVSSAAFCTDNNPPDAIRLCLGGATSKEELEKTLPLLVDTLNHPSHLSNFVY